MKKTLLLIASVFALAITTTLNAQDGATLVAGPATVEQGETGVSIDVTYEASAPSDIVLYFRETGAGLIGNPVRLSVPATNGAPEIAQLSLNVPSSLSVGTICEYVVFLATPDGWDGDIIGDYAGQYNVEVLPKTATANLVNGIVEGTATVVGPTSTVDVVVSYESIDPDNLLVVYLQRTQRPGDEPFQGDYVAHGEAIVTVPAGFSASYTIPVPVVGAVEGSVYRWMVFMLPATANTENAFDERIQSAGVEYQNGVTVDPSFSLSDFELENGFVIYPNPVETEFSINLPKESGTIEIISLNGKVVMSQTASGLTKVNVEGLNTGIYLCHYSNDKGTKTIKLVKE